MTAPTFTKTGTKATTAAKLDANVFEVAIPNHQLLKDVYDAYLANGRTNLAVVKTRGLVSGGGRKPWKQKGTGRARFGSSRNPIWRGGGIVFGPTGLENYSKGVNTKAKRQALRQALSIANTDKKIKVIETFDCKEGKVAQTVKLLSKIEANGRVLIVVSKKDDLVNRATNNLPGVKVVQASYLNVYDVLNANNIVISEKALGLISDHLAVTKPTATAKEAAK
jgi:large subunit ribosomal protein L4